MFPMSAAPRVGSSIPESRRRAREELIGGSLHPNESALQHLGALLAKIAIHFALTKERGERSARELG